MYFLSLLVPNFTRNLYNFVLKWYRFNFFNCLQCLTSIEVFWVLYLCDHPCEKKSTFLYWNFFLPEHPSACVGQSLFSCARPTHSSPPFAGGGLVQVLVRVLWPWRQYLGSVHVLQSDQVEKTPSTAPGKIFLSLSIKKNWQASRGMRWLFCVRTAAAVCYSIWLFLFFPIWTYCILDGFWIGILSFFFINPS